MNERELNKAILYLRPNAQFSFTKADYSTIKWDVLEDEPPSLAELEAAHLQIKELAIAEAETRAADKAALLDRLGITEAEAKLLLS